GVHVIYRAIEKALDLVGVQVDRNNAVRARSSQQVSNQAGGDGLTAEVLFILASIWVKRQDGRDALGRAALERINHDELLHEPLIQRLRVRLQHEAVSTAHGLFEANEDFANSKVARGSGNQIGAQFLGNGLSQIWVGASGKQHHILAAIRNLAGHSGL